MTQQTIRPKILTVKEALAMADERLTNLEVLICKFLRNTAQATYNDDLADAVVTLEYESKRLRLIAE